MDSELDIIQRGRCVANIRLHLYHGRWTWLEDVVVAIEDCRNEFDGTVHPVAAVDRLDSRSASIPFRPEFIRRCGRRFYSPRAFQLGSIVFLGIRVVAVSPTHLFPNLRRRRLSTQIRKGRPKSASVFKISSNHNTAGGTIEDATIVQSKNVRGQATTHATWTCQRVEAPQPIRPGRPVG